MVVGLGTPAPNTQCRLDAQSQGIGRVDEETLSLAGQRSATLVTNDRALFYSAKVRGVKAKWFTLISEEAAQAALLSTDEGY